MNNPREKLSASRIERGSQPTDPLAEGRQPASSPGFAAQHPSNGPIRADHSIRGTSQSNPIQARADSQNLQKVKRKSLSPTLSSDKRKTLSPRPDAEGKPPSPRLLAQPEKRRSSSAGAAGSSSRSAKSPQTVSKGKKDASTGDKKQKNKKKLVRHSSFPSSVPQRGSSKSRENVHYHELTVPAYFKSTACQEGPASNRSSSNLSLSASTPRKGSEVAGMRKLQTLEHHSEKGVQCRLPHEITQLHTLRVISQAHAVLTRDSSTQTVSDSATQTPDGVISSQMLDCPMSGSEQEEEAAIRCAAAGAKRILLEDPRLMPLQHWQNFHDFLSMEEQKLARRSAKPKLVQPQPINPAPLLPPDDETFGRVSSAAHGLISDEISDGDEALECEEEMFKLQMPEDGPCVSQNSERQAQACAPDPIMMLSDGTYKATHKKETHSAPKSPKENGTGVFSGGIPDTTGPGNPPPKVPALNLAQVIAVTDTARSVSPNVMHKVEIGSPRSAFSPRSDSSGWTTPRPNCESTPPGKSMPCCLVEPSLNDS